MAVYIVEQFATEEFIEIPVPPAPPQIYNPWVRVIRLASSIACAAITLPLLWLSVGALWGQARLPTDGTLMPALTGISVNSALLFIFITDYIAARTGSSD